MAKEKTEDQIVQELFDLVQKKKSEIAKINKPDWKTNCTFVSEGGERCNLHVESNVNVLIGILGYLWAKQQAFNAAADELSLSGKYKFTYGGYSYNDWKSDISVRIAKIEINTKIAELNKYEARLDAVLSPELKRKMEIEAISKELANS